MMRLLVLISVTFAVWTGDLFAEDARAEYVQSAHSREAASQGDPEDAEFEEFFELVTEYESNRFARMAEQVSDEIQAFPDASMAEQQKRAEAAFQRLAGRRGLSYLPPVLGLKELPLPVLRAALALARPSSVRTLRDKLLAREEPVLMAEAVQADMRHQYELALNGRLGWFTAGCTLAGGFCGLWVSQKEQGIAAMGAPEAGFFLLSGVAGSWIERNATKFLGRYRLMESIAFAEALGEPVPAVYHATIENSCARYFKLLVP